MPLQNRVTPLGELIADPARGLVYGNRGCLHDAEGTIRRRFQVKRWIACRLEFKGRRRVEKLRPGRYTELFFLDEATAFAAGHRPCAECRRADYVRFLELVGESRATAIDERLHVERLAPYRTAALDTLPDAVVRAPGRRALARARRRASALVARRLHRVVAAPPERRSDGGHPTVASRRAPRGLRGSSAPPAPEC